MIRGWCPLKKSFHPGDHVQWNSEAGLVRGVILKKISAPYNFKGYIHHASPSAPQYLIQSDKTTHIAIHKPSALKLLPPLTKKSPRPKSPASKKPRPRRKKSPSRPRM